MAELERECPLLMLRDIKRGRPSCIVRVGGGVLGRLQGYTDDDAEERCDDDAEETPMITSM